MTAHPASMTAHPARIVTYCRVSTAKQGVSGLGIEAQQAAIAAYVERSGVEVVGQFVEQVSGKGANARKLRKELDAAMVLAKKSKATLVIAKLDRLARNVHFISGLMESGVPFLALDNASANKLTIHILAAVAENERDMASQRTKEALARAILRGTVMGAKVLENTAAWHAARKEGARERAEAMRDDLAVVAHLSLWKASAALALKGHVTKDGKPFSATQVQRLLKRLDLVEAQAA